MVCVYCYRTVARSITTDRLSSYQKKKRSKDGSGSGDGSEPLTLIDGAQFDNPKWARMDCSDESM